LREARRVCEGERYMHGNPYLLCMKNHFLPVEFEQLCNLQKEEIEQHIERIERDLQDARAGEFRIE